MGHGKTGERAFRRDRGTVFGHGKTGERAFGRDEGTLWGMGRQWKGHLGDTEGHFWGMGETGEHFGAWEDRREEIWERRGNFFRHGKTGARALERDW